MAARGEKVLTTVSFKVFRFDPEMTPEPHYITFPVTVKEGMTVLDGLLYILEKLDNSLAFRFCCRGAVCGSCAMYINGAYRLACQTQLSVLGDEIVISPLPHLPLIKDLVVDMTSFYTKFDTIIPYLKTLSPPPQREYIQDPKQRRALDEVTDCIWCGACYSACPLTWINKDYLGPAALVKAYRFVADSRDEAKGERLRIVDEEKMIWRCHTIFNCVEACPKNINQTKAIEGLRRKVIWHRLKWW
jgi:succinate dehydrogenase / fumarate reductase iron-sulfur subunit